MQALHHLNIEVTRQCNQRCVYCFNDSGPWVRSSSLSSDQWLHILGVLQTMGLRSVHITGGEPFVWKGTVDLLRGAQRLGLDTSILSNGYRIPELAAFYPIAFSQLQVAQISLDSVDSTLHDQRRGMPNAWRQAVDAIVCLRELLIPVEVSSVISDTNVDQLPELAEFCQIRACRLLPRLLIHEGRGRTFEPESLVADRYRTMLQRVQHDYPGLCVTDRYFYVPSTPELDCQAQLSGFHTVSPEGRLRAAPINVGNICVYELRRLLTADFPTERN